MIRCQIAAQVAQDGNGRPYPTLCIPEPRSWDRWNSEMKEFRKIPRSEIGINPDVKVPEAPKVLVLRRGGEPVELVLSEELHRHLSVDKKNLLIFGVEKIEEEAPKARKV